MSVKVRVPTTLRTLTAGQSEVEVEGANVGEVIKSLDSAHPGFAERLLDDNGLRRFVNVFVADDDVRFLDGLDTEGPRRGNGVDHPRRRRRLSFPSDSPPRELRPQVGAPTPVAERAAAREAPATSRTRRRQERSDAGAERRQRFLSGLRMNLSMMAACPRS